MRLGDLIPAAARARGGAADAAEVEISGLAYDSRRVAPGALFFCVPGARSDGHDHAEQALRAGAAGLVVERALGLGVPEVLVRSARAAMGPAAARFYGDPSAELEVVGVTGTNGKTTTAFLVRALLEASGRRCGLLGTVKSVVGGQERGGREHPIQRTTPEAIDLQADLRAMLDGGERACAMEVSSHALELGRTGGVRFAAAIFTNLTQDHLDFHGTMEEYFQCKRRLFVPAAPAHGIGAPGSTPAGGLPAGSGGTSVAPGVSVINLDDPYGRRLAAELPDALTFAIEHDADYRARDLRAGFDGCRLRLETPRGARALALPMPGRFNVANALGALAAVHALGADLDTLIAALERGVRVPGRFEPVEEGQEFAVLVDYAHTPDSLENVLRAARELAGGRVVCVFGAGGDRDRGKRPLMGEIAARLAEVVLVTSDNPRSEDPEAIIAEILAGAARARAVGTSPVGAPPPRRAAIARARPAAQPGDVVVIAGKGHEQGQELADGVKVPFDDVAVAREALRARRARDPGPPPLGGVSEWDAARVAAAAGARLSRGGPLLGSEPAGSAEAHAGGPGGSAGAGAVPGGGGPDAIPGGGGPGASAGEGGRARIPGPRRVVVDSRGVRPGDLFVGLPGERVDGGAYAAQALRAGAWGVLVAPAHAAPLLSGGAAPPAAAVLVHPDPLAGLQSLARAWRRALGEAGARVVAVTGSTGKTSTKDILAALLGGAEALAKTGTPAAGRRPPASVGGPTVASPQNLNTEIGLPLAVLAAPAGTRVLVLEMAMRGRGQIAQLAEIAEPEVGVIVNVGPVHLEQLGSLEAVAAAKAELIAGMAPGTTVVVPAGEPLLEPHLRGDLRTVSFGEGGEVELLQRGAGRSSIGGEVVIVDRGAGGEHHGAGGERIVLRPSFGQSHNLRNLLAAVAAARALGVTPAGSVEVEFSALRGERVALENGIVLINDCYNANPMSMRAALDDLAESAPARRVAVLGDMLELGPEERRLHREVGAYARERGVELLVAVGPLAQEMGDGLDGSVHRVPDAAAAAALLPRLLRAGDSVLVKGSRGVGLELVAETLAGAGAPVPAGPSAAAGEG
jgi:UDP-N-acetylmuramoyl-L-alanyl-D-glutamate--2,6-diaminopimelate ligase